MSKEFVDQHIQSSKVLIFSKSTCSCSKKARATLESIGLKPEAVKWVEIDKREDCAEIQDYLESLTGARSVPRVFINGKFFGGGDATVAAANSGELVELLQEVGAL
ncbi:hypothetical protein CAEBREN_04233 [Caenorhabditis brenneri]|uniref:Glutaredoxin domain-containing protein n=1 Tax=Caenorhabditis brenneri TaxID=135651 RepID=G0NMG6_CAEBE|nr:hypothetical protein CAEBREN_04233 [Caenorhabditis brenneri]